MPIKPFRLLRQLDGERPRDLDDLRDALVAGVELHAARLVTQ